MRADKKNEGDTIRFVVLDRLGHASVADDVSRSEARQAWDFACSS
jgi:3-dehydroquinate synthase